MVESVRAVSDDSPAGEERRDRLFASAKDERLAEAGRKGARRRWGPARLVRLDDLGPIERRLVLALIDAARSNPPAGNAA